MLAVEVVKRHPRENLLHTRKLTCTSIQHVFFAEVVEILVQGAKLRVSMFRTHVYNPLIISLPLEVEIKLKIHFLSNKIDLFSSCKTK